ncbi:MAG: hypothetical protein HZA50_14785 [Planctomycetes bacterium]|nr:hypothetical protein [Planctomycetota bacterium]
MKIKHSLLIVMVLVIFAAAFNWNFCLSQSSPPTGTTPESRTVTPRPDNVFPNGKMDRPAAGFDHITPMVLPAKDKDGKVLDNFVRLVVLLAPPRDMDFVSFFKDIEQYSDINRTALNTSPTVVETYKKPNLRIDVTIEKDVFARKDIQLEGNLEGGKGPGIAGGTNPHWAIQFNRLRLFIDGNNNDAFDIPEMTDEENNVKFSPYSIGKLIPVNNNDKNSNGIPDYKEPVAVGDQTGHLVPMVIKLPQDVKPENAYLEFNYSESTPPGTPAPGTLAKGYYRIWKDEVTSSDKSINVDNNGKFIPSGAKVEWVKLTKKNDPKLQEDTFKTVFIEAVRAKGLDGGTTPKKIIVSLYIKENNKDILFGSDFVKIMPFRIDIDTDTDNNGTIDDEEDIDSVKDANVKDALEENYEHLVPGKVVRVNKFGDAPANANDHRDDLAKVRIRMVLPDGVKPESITTGRITFEIKKIATNDILTIWKSEAKDEVLEINRIFDLSIGKERKSFLKLLNTDDSKDTFLYADGLKYDYKTTANNCCSLAIQYAMAKGKTEFIPASSDETAFTIVNTISYAPKYSKISIWSATPWDHDLWAFNGSTFRSEPGIWVTIDILSRFGWTNIQTSTLIRDNSLDRPDGDPNHKNFEGTNINLPDPADKTGKALQNSSDPNDPKLPCGDLKLNALKQLPSNSGYIIMCSHGSQEGHFCAAFFGGGNIGDRQTRIDKAKKSANAWIRAGKEEPPNPNIKDPAKDPTVLIYVRVETFKPLGYPDLAIAAVMIKPKWFENNWKKTLDENNAVVFWQCCFGAGNVLAKKPGYENSLAAKAGGRVRLGYPNVSWGSQHQDDSECILSTMLNFAKTKDNIIQPVEETVVNRSAYYEIRGIDSPESKEYRVIGKLMPYCTYTNPDVPHVYKGVQSKLVMICPDLDTKHPLIAVPNINDPKDPFPSNFNEYPCYWTTLHPIIQLNIPSTEIFGTAANPAMAGMTAWKPPEQRAGAVVFDTYMNASVKAEDALIAEPPLSLKMVKWHDDKQNMPRFMLSFIYKPSTAEIKFTAVGDKCRSYGIDDPKGGRGMVGELSNHVDKSPDPNNKNKKMYESDKEWKAMK